MSAPAALLPETLPSDWARPMADGQLAILGRLAEAGLEIAIALEGQAKGGDVVVEGDIANAYARVARAVRQTIMLQSKLIEALQDKESARAGRKAAAKASAARIVRDVIDDERANDKERSERLRAEAAERLEAEDFTEFAARPFGAVVAGVCKALGLEPDWLALAQDCAAAEAALDAKPGSKPAEPKYEGPIEIQWLGSDDSS